jgi:plastocyanin
MSITERIPLIRQYLQQQFPKHLIVDFLEGAGRSQVFRVDAPQCRSIIIIMRLRRFVNSAPLIARTGALVLLLLLTVPGVRLSAAVSVLEPDGQGLQRATITMDSYSYSPNELSVQAGKPVELTLQNAATFIPHSFVLEDPASGLDVRAEVSAGESQTIRFIPTRTGTFAFYCEKKLLFFKSHRERGQEGRLEVR